MYKNNPLVSIIMSEYDTDPVLLIHSIESVNNQTYKNLEIIIVDDCGKNNLKKILLDANINDCRIKILNNSSNKGLVYSLNRAIREANGKYIARMDTDDASYLDRIAKQVKFLEKHQDIDVVGSNVEYCDGKKIWGYSNLNGEVTYNQIIASSPLVHPTVMMRKEVLEKVGGYPNYERCEDYALWITLFSSGYKLYNMSDKLLRYHLSLEDYKKRTIMSRKDFFKMIKTCYIPKLKPTKKQIIKIYLKNIVAGILPKKIIYKYHIKKFGRSDHE